MVNNILELKHRRTDLLLTEKNIWMKTHPTIDPETKNWFDNTGNNQFNDEDLLTVWRCGMCYADLSITFAEKVFTLFTHYIHVMITIWYIGGLLD